MSPQSGEKLPAHLRTLADLGLSGDLNMRPVLFRVVCDLFLLKQHHSRDEVLQFEEMALRMMPGLDDALLAVVAARVAAHPDTPGSVLRQFLARSEAVSGPVYASAAALRADNLKEAAYLGSAETAVAVARRETLEPEVAQLLAERPEEGIVLALLDNRGARVNEATQAYLIRRARHSPGLATAVAARDDFGGDMSALYLSAPPARRKAIVLSARRLELGASPPPPVAAHEAAGLKRLERLALARDMPGFVAALAVALTCKRERAERLAQDATGEPLALALVAAGMRAEPAARIFMCMAPAIAHSVERVHALADLVASVPRAAAMRLVAAMLNLPAPAALAAETPAARALPSRPQVHGGVAMRPLRQEEGGDIPAMSGAA